MVDENGYMCYDMDVGGECTLDKKIASGTYKYQIDSKGRVRIPAKLKDALGKDLLIGYGAGEYLVIYSQEMVCNLNEKYSGVEVYAGDQYDSIREMTENLFSFECDAQDRYQIPLALRESVGLKEGEIYFIGVFNKVEIWSEENYFKRKDKSVSQSRLAGFKDLK